MSHSRPILPDTPDVSALSSPPKTAPVSQLDGSTKVHRPWGWYHSLDTGEGDSGHQVKRIHVHPGGSLSLQSHAHRAEHWVVVQGLATISVGPAISAMEDKDYLPGQYVYIPLGALHRLSNKTHKPVDLIEVQCGDYLGEDDIVRYEDVYGRV
jgi:mannose-1-phosphate guanylyltransferase / mannose-6-phosphate isomerase